MATNDFVPFCGTTTGTNLLTQSAYLADAQRPIGNQPGVARSQLVNKALRQGTWIASQIAQYISDRTGNDVLDNEISGDVLATMKQAFSSASSVTSHGGNYTLLYTDDTVLFTAAAIATLPTAVGVLGKRFTIKNISTSATVSLATTSGQTIDGRAASQVKLAVKNSFVTVESDNTNWIIVNSLEPINARYHVSIATSVAQYVPINYDTLDVDTHSAVTTGAGTWIFTAPAAGIYLINGTFLSSTIANYNWMISVNGVTPVDFLCGVDSASQIFTGSITVKLALNDTLSLETDLALVNMTAGAKYNVANITRVGE